MLTGNYEESHYDWWRNRDLLQIHFVGGRGFRTDLDTWSSRDKTGACYKFSRFGNYPVRFGKDKLFLLRQTMCTSSHKVNRKNPEG